MRFLYVFMLCSLFGSLLPATASAAEADPYADSLYQSGTNFYLPENALGAPDGVSASIFAKDAFSTYDMGQGEEGTGNLFIYLTPRDYGAAVRVEFLDASMTRLLETSHVFNVGETKAEISYGATEPYRYVKLTSTEEEEWILDAIEAETIAVQAEEEPTEEGGLDEETSAEETAVNPRGMLVKLVDDGNAQTTVDAAVYEIGGDGKRHAFPNETVFFSWYENYDDVAFIDPVSLAGYELGGNVTVRPGTWLVKITTDPKVYAVEPGGVLRWVTTETVAASIYGEDWAHRVIDVPDVFFLNYAMGDDLTTTIPPTGTLAETPSGEIVYIQNGSYYGIGGTDAHMRFDYGFAVTLDEDTFGLLVDAGDLDENADIAYPY